MGHAVYKLADDRYVEWSSVVDAPVSYLATRAQSVQRWGADRVGRADLNGHSYVDGYEASPSTPEDLICVNRAGPGEERLTLEAILRRYASPEACDAPVTPSEVMPIWTNGWLEDGRDADEHGPVFVWMPWRPGEAPDEMPEHYAFHQMQTRIMPDELARLQESGR